MISRREFLSFGAISALTGLVGCGGGGGVIVVSPATGWTAMPASIVAALPTANEGGFNSAIGFSRYDLSDVNFMAQLGWTVNLPPPGQQGQQPSCTAWAVGYAAATTALRYSGFNLVAPISPADLFAKILLRSPLACSQGSQIHLAMDTLVQQGVTTLDFAPYLDRQCGIPSVQPSFTIDGYSLVPATDLFAIRGSIVSNQPVSFGILVTNDIFSVSALNPVWVPNGTGSGHAMTVIGFDDSLQRFKIINSWGTTWGQGGYFWISYNDFARFASDVCIPYVRRGASQPFTGSSSVPGSPAFPQYMNSTAYGIPSTGSYGLGVELGWSSLLSLQAATLEGLDAASNPLFTQNFVWNQIARGIRFGCAVPAGVAALYTQVRATLTGFDTFGTLITITFVCAATANRLR